MIEWFLTILALGGAVFPASTALADEPAKGRPRAPADYQIVSSDRAGAYFVARPLKERYDKLVGQLATLRLDIAGARIAADEARQRVDQLSIELEGLKKQIEQSKIYIPGATVQNAKATDLFAIAADDFLLVDAPNVELRGWDKPEVRWVVEKTILSPDDKGVAEDFAGIAVMHRKATGKELFGFYKDIAGKPQWKKDWDQFRFKEFLDREFYHVKLVGLIHDEGNRQITVEVKNEQGAGEMSSQWRRQAKLVLYVPKCGHIGVRGGLAGFKIEGVNAPVTVVGEGDRDYEASYEVAKITGSLSADNITLHRVDDVKGDVSIVATAYAGNVGTVHDNRGITIEPGVIHTADYRNIDGNLRVRFVRSDLSIGRVSGRIDIENDFGHTTWLADTALGKHDHRVVSQSGTIELRLGKSALSGLPLALYTECGIVYLAPGMEQGLEDSSFSSSSGDAIYRSWHGFVTGRAARAGLMEQVEHVAAALHGQPRKPGVDIICRGGAIRLLPARP